MLAHRDPVLLTRLTGGLRAAGADVLLHVDKRSREIDDHHDALRALGVRFLPRYATPWGTFGLARAAMSGLVDAVHECDADYVVLLSGQDYPIKPLPTFHDELAALEGRSVMYYFPLPTDFWTPARGLGRVDAWYQTIGTRNACLPFGRRQVHLAGREIRIAPRRRLPAFPIYGGSQFWALSREASAAAVAAFEQRRPEFWFFRHALVPDELAFTTPVLNAVGEDRVVNKQLHELRWNEVRRSPVLLQDEDFPMLVRSPRPFARKFDSQVSAGLLDRIDHELLDDSMRAIGR